MPNSSKLTIFLPRATLKFDGWPWKTTGHLCYATSSFVHHFIAISEFKLELQSGNAQFGLKSAGFFCPCDFEIWRMTLKINRAPLLCYFKLCASFHSNWSIQTAVTVRIRPNWGKICFDLCDLDIWPLTLTFSMNIPFVNGNNSWKFNDDLIKGTLWNGVTNWQTDGRTEVFLELIGRS